MKISRKYDLSLNESLIWSINSKSADLICCTLHVPNFLKNMEKQILVSSLKESTYRLS